MVVVVYAGNEDAGWRDLGRAVAAERWPGATVRVVTPAFFSPRELEDCDAVVVHPKHRHVADPYAARGTYALITDGLPASSPPITALAPTVTAEPVPEPPPAPAPAVSRRRRAR